MHAKPHMLAVSRAVRPGGSFIACGLPPYDCVQGDSKQFTSAGVLHSMRPSLFSISGLKNSRRKCAVCAPFVVRFAAFFGGARHFQPTYSPCPAQPHLRRTFYAGGWIEAGVHPRLEGVGAKCCCCPLSPV